MLWILRTGAPWPDLPERYGPPSTVSTRLYRWKKAGIWDRILAAVQAEADAAGELDWETHHVDATVIRAHQHAAGAKKGTQKPRHLAAAKGDSAPKSISAVKETESRSHLS
jgi:transposase